MTRVLVPHWRTALQTHRQLRRADGNVWRSRIQTYDSTFGQEATDPITLHFQSLPSVHQSQPGVSLFNDTLQVPGTH